MTALTIAEIVSVASAGIRGIALTDTLDDLDGVAETVRNAYDVLENALDAANAEGPKNGADATPADRAVVDAAKAYAKAEETWLRTLQAYLMFAQGYAYDFEGVSGSGDNDDVVKGLLPNV